MTRKIKVGIIQQANTKDLMRDEWIKGKEDRL